MPKTTYIATDAAGTIHKRTAADRTYTHTVVQFNGGLDGYLKARKLWADVAERDLRANWNYFVEVATQGKDHRYAPVMTAATLEHRIDMVAKGLDQSIADVRAEAEAREDARRDTGYFEKWTNLGWCGRLDLAQKLAAKSGGAILEARKKT